MRKNYAFFLFSLIGFAQNPEIKSDVPTFMPPSPTVAALMKFEEIKVGNYTGTPNVSIPFYSSSTRAKNLNFDISLNYHSGGTAVDEKASDVGLGWSLFAGGTISRTVRNIPDEYYDTQGIVSSGNGKIGIYNNNTTYKNNYHQVVDLYNSGSALLTNEVMNEFMWNATERNLYDTEYDLWQFNFMGHSGQFIIKKNVINNTIEVSNLDLTSDLKIINIYNPTSFAPIAFNVFDSLGYKYVFDVVETTKSNSTTTSYPQYGTDIKTNFTKDITFISAFHLTKIYDNNNNKLVQIDYSSESEKCLEKVIDRSSTYNEFDPSFIPNLEFLANNFMPGQINNIDPKSTETLSQRRINTKKIKTVSVEGQCKIDFNYLKGREDTNLQNPDSSYVFKGIVIKDWNNINIKKIDIEQNYSTVIDKRMMLYKVKFKNFIDTKEEVYELAYRVNSNNSGLPITKDLWGCFKIPNSLYENNREVNPNFCTTDLLQKMTIPSGGCIVFDFEANTYSNIRDNAVTNFDDNALNWNEQLVSIPFTTVNNGIKSAFFTINESQDVHFSSLVNTNNPNVFRDYSFNIYKTTGGIDAPVQNIGIVCYSCENYNQENTINLTPGNYKVSFNTVDLELNNELINATVTANYRIKNSNNFQYYFGGGNRIKKIGYFKSSGIPKNVYQDLLNLSPDKEKKYNYNFFNQPSKSSGSIVLDKPVYQYEFSSNYYFYLSTYSDFGTDAADIYEFMFTKKTDFNNIKGIKTSGSEIGYQNVEVEEVNNGKTQYTYTSPIDFPESIALVNTYPFLSCYNIDFKRGLIKKEVNFDNVEKKLLETNYDYTFDEVPYQNTVYGLTTNPLGMNSPFNYLLPNYFSFKDAYNKLNYTNGIGCVDENSIGSYYYITCNFKNRIHLPREYIDINLLYSSNGWAKLTNKTTKNYFYPNGGTTPNILQVIETYTYNSLNKKISETSVTNSQGETLKSKYFYHTGNSIFSQNRISEIEKTENYRGTELLSTNKINYSNTFAGNVSFLPQTIVTAKGSQITESRVKYNSYDEFSNPLELQQENGTVISYIWGYNKTQPIAKIENASYSLVASQVANLQTISNTGTEASLLAALATLRSTASLANAFITTFTYKPVIGVSTITDPKGDKITYNYDAFGRLQNVKDKDGNILSENEYHYKN